VEANEVSKNIDWSIVHCRVFALGLKEDPAFFGMQQTKKNRIHVASASRL